MIYKVPNQIILVILVFCAVKIAQTDAANQCKDTDGEVNVGWRKPVTCKKIRRKHPHLCNTKNSAKESCPVTCNTCGFDPIVSCEDTKGKFALNNVRRNCNAVAKNHRHCRKPEFQFNCPQECNMCNQQGFNQCTLGGAGECCNSHPDTCGVKVNELLFAAVHNANADGFFGNNNAPLEDAVEAGYRALYLDVCECDGALSFCHGNCNLGRRDPTEVFTNIVSFLQDNPTELIIFNFQISYGNPTPLQLWNLMDTVDGLKEMSYKHNSGNWPTIGSLLESGKQIISFKHNGINCYNTGAAGCTPFIQEFFDYTIGTDWDFGSVSQINDYEDSCEGIRGTTNKKQFYAINHFVTTFLGPSEGAADTLNQRNSLEARISNCEIETNREPNFVAIDFWQKGDLLEVAQDVNTERAASRRRL
mmetsp:Transcript_1746/g.2310  ORF Transcript_1746/g.2310 Transcript_1746/m.2310 type:complete len:418 (+) Transcript_1746:63-1316(+)